MTQIAYFKIYLVLHKKGRTPFMDAPTNGTYAVEIFA